MHHIHIRGIIVRGQWYKDIFTYNSHLKFNLGFIIVFVCSRKLKFENQLLLKKKWTKSRILQSSANSVSKAYHLKKSTRTWVGRVWRRMPPTSYSIILKVLQLNWNEAEKARKLILVHYNIIYIVRLIRDWIWKAVVLKDSYGVE